MGQEGSSRLAAYFSLNVFRDCTGAEAMWALCLFETFLKTFLPVVNIGFSTCNNQV